MELDIDPAKGSGMSDDISQMTDRELDAAVAEEVMGWAVHERNTAWYVSAEKQNAVDVAPSFLVSEWHPSYHWGQAGEVIEAMREAGYGIDIYIHPGCEIEHPYFVVCTRRPDVDISAGANNAPRAICEAALKTTRAKGQGDDKDHTDTSR